MNRVGTGRESCLGKSLEKRRNPGSQKEVSEICKIFGCKRIAAGDVPEKRPSGAAGSHP